MKAAATLAAAVDAAAAADCPSERLDAQSLGRLFRDARTYTAWQSRPVPQALLHELYELTALGPTSANCLPARIVFVSSAAAKQRLLPLMAEGNREQTRLAPVTAIVAYDLEFHAHLPRLYPHQPEARTWFNGSAAQAREAALRNGSLQGGYFIMAARALGLDCGPMGGFDAQAVRAAFLPAGFEVNFLCNLGYGRRPPRHPRLPRLPFETACRII
jgi:nitroreductase